MKYFSIPHPTQKGGEFKLGPQHKPSSKLVTAEATLALLNRLLHIICIDIFAYAHYHQQIDRDILDIPKTIVSLPATYVSLCPIGRL